MPGPYVSTGITPGGHLPPDKTLYQFISDDGTPSGNYDANGDYSASVEEFYLLADGEYVAMEGMIGTIEDTGKLLIGGYGAIAGGLTNGITLLVKDEGGATVISSQAPIKTSEDWASVCHDWVVHAFDNTTNTKQVGTFRWMFGKAGNPVVLRPGWKFVIQFNDDLTGLDKHRFHMQGYKL